MGYASPKCNCWQMTYRDSPWSSDEIAVSRSDARPEGRAYLLDSRPLRNGYGQGGLPLDRGVRVQGGSGVLHECDVVVLQADEAALSRRESVAPRGSKCLLAIECKYYTTHLGIELARNFEGLHADLRAQHELFVSNTSAPNVLRYLSARKREYEPLVAPSAPDRVQEVRSQIRRAFKSYLSGYTGSALI
jgi:hypothetical protein